MKLLRMREFYPVWVGIAVMAVAGTVLFAPPASAQQRHDLFTVYSVPVDVSARTATQARTEALAEVQREALTRLYTKLANWDESRRIPEQSDAEIVRLVRGIEVVEERLSARRYIGEFNISFDPAGIRALFLAGGVPYTETPSRSTLVIPVWQEAGAYQLWTGGAEWQDAWQEANPKNRLIAYRFAEGGIRDRLMLTADQALRGDSERLRKIAGHYGAEDVVVAIAKRVSGSGADKIEFAYRHGFAGTSFVEGQITGREGDTGQMLLTRAADAIMRRADLKWKTQTLLTNQEKSRLDVYIMADTAEDWAQIEQRLDSIPIIREVIIKKMTVPLIHVAVDYLGSRDQLSLALSQADITLEESEGLWLLKITDKQVAQIRN